MNQEDKKKYEDAAERVIRHDEDVENVEVVEKKEEEKEEIKEQPVEEKPKNLGKAIKFQTDDREEKKKQKDLFGFIELVKENLPSGGRFYGDDMKIYIKPAQVQEIRDFSTIDETNLFDIDDKLNNILVTCTKIYIDGRKGSYRDILEEDRIYVLLSIRESTFVEGESKLNLKGICGSCDTENHFDLRTSNLQYNEESLDLAKYYSHQEKTYVIQTKSAGVLRLSPPTIGVMKEITSYIKKKEEKKEKWDKAFMQIMPYLVNTWRGFTDKAIFDNLVEYQGWSMNKYTLVFRLAEKLRVGIKQELSYPCIKCGAEVTVPVDFPGGIKSLFIPQDIEGELL